MALVVINPEAGSIDEFRTIRQELRSRSHYVVRESRRPGDGAMWVRKALSNLSSDERLTLVVMGGDGTIHGLLNAVAPQLHRLRLAILPAGTGNDLARSLQLPLDPREAFEWLEHGDTLRPLDVMDLEIGKERHIGLNACHGGYGGQIAREVTPSMKERFGPFAYLAAGSEALDERNDYETHVRWYDGTRDSLEAVGVLIANGGSIGGGFSIAPDVDPTDDILDVYLLRSGTLLDLADFATRIAAGRLESSAEVLHRSTRGMRLLSRPAMQYSLDGDPYGTHESLELSLRAHSLPVLAPEDDRGAHTR